MVRTLTPSSDTIAALFIAIAGVDPGRVTFSARFGTRRVPLAGRRAA
jgi:hypothetical protein